MSWQNKLVSDDVLISLYVKGLETAFNQLYARHKNTLFSFIKRQCRGCDNEQSIAEDIFHDTWLAIIKNPDAHRQQCQFKTWLFKIAQFKIADYWRGHYRDQQYFSLTQDGKTTAMTPQETRESNNSCELSITHKEQIELILDRLPNEQRTAILLKAAGFSRSEIANITGTNEQTVKSRIRYANQKIALLRESTS